MAKVTQKTTVKKSVAKPAAKSAVKKVAAKAPAKAAPVKKAAAKPAAKTAAKPAPKSAAKPSAKPSVKAATRSTAKPAAKPASQKTGAAAKSPAKKTGAAGKAVKSVVKSPFKSAAPSAPKTMSKAKAANQNRAHKAGAKATATSKAQAPISLKGLRVSGDKAARIAQIVAESFLNKAAAETKAQDQAAAYTITPSENPTVSDPGSALEAAHKAAAVLFSKKAEEVVLMDLRNLSTVADYYLIATCTNEPQMRSILSTVQRSLSREGIKSLRSEYMPGVRWAVVDYGDMILHLFEKQTRGFYSLERLWADAPSTLLKATDYALPANDDDEDAEDDGDL